MLKKLKTGFCKDKIQITPDNKYACIFDIIKVVGGQKSPKKTWYDIEKKYKNENEISKIDKFKFSGQGKKETPCYLIENILDLIKIILISSRVAVSYKEIIMDHFDIPYDKLNVKKYIEEEIHQNILKVFSSEDFVQQYTVLGYRLDLYSIKYKIAIECDENHEYYNKTFEINRQKEITKELNCKWIRYKPYDKHFDLFILIKNIYDLINQMKE